MQRQDRAFRIFAVCIVVALLAVAAINLYQARRAAPSATAITYSQFLDELDRGRVHSIRIGGHAVVGTFADGTRFSTYTADDPDLVTTLRTKHVAITAVEPPAAATSSMSVVGALLPTLLLIGFAFYFMRRMPNSGGRDGGLGQSRAKLLTTARPVTFSDVAGVDEARDALQEIVDFLRDPSRFQRLGGRIPTGVLLVGPPGTGKTLLARAIAGEAGVPFFTISGSDFVEMFVGVGASRVRTMFEQAKKAAPCIIFMDEIDAVGRRRGAGVGGGNDEREQTLNQLLVEMDGFIANEGVILIAATNRPDVLDPALLRSGRFDREIVVSNPDIMGREHILAVHVREVPLGADVDLKILAKRTPGFSGADLMNLVNEAALLAARRAKTVVEMREFEDARDTVTMGAERRTHVMTEDERRMIAYREAGRAIVALNIPAADPVHKATIMPRGRSLGMVKQLPEDDAPSQTREQLNARLAILMSGRAAEEMVVGRARITSGTGRDIDEATRLARTMVTRWGLSDDLGAVAYGEDEEEVFLGHSIARPNTISEETAQLIIVEIRGLLGAALASATRILTETRGQFDILVAGLLRYETLSGDEIRDLLLGRAPSR